MGDISTAPIDATLSDMLLNLILGEHNITCIESVRIYNEVSEIKRKFFIFKKKKYIKVLEFMVDEELYVMESLTVDNFDLRAIAEETASFDKFVVKFI